MQTSSDFAKILTQEWLRRQKNNSRYSLRAFAGSLSISPSRLSDFLNGKGGLSASRALEIAKRLNLSEEEFETVHYVIQKEMPTAKSAKEFSRTVLKTQNKKFNYAKSVASRDIIDRLEWTHLYIAEIVSDEALNRNQIARRLGLHVLNVDQLLSEAKQLNLVIPVPDKKDFWQAADASRRFGDAKASAKIRQLHFQMLKQIPQLCEASANEERELSSSLMQLDQQQVALLRLMIQKFVKSCLAISNKKKSEDPRLYGLSLQLFPIEIKTKNKKENL